MCFMAFTPTFSFVVLTDNLFVSLYMESFTISRISRDCGNKWGEELGCLVSNGGDVILVKLLWQDDEGSD